MGWNTWAMHVRDPVCVCNYLSKLLSGSIAGVDDVDSYEELCHFISTVSERSGVKHFVVHARKCILAGLSPAQNRMIPPLRCGPSSAMLAWPFIHQLDSLLMALAARQRGEASRRPCVQ